MAVQHEIKSQLAKLLATEDLIVEHKNCDTACFNVHTRVLTLPMWEKASNTVYDLLVGHEVGHALFTPDENWLEKVAVPPQFVNVVEDARIEKMMKRKYAGLAKTFYHGYKELQAEDFFSISDSNVADLNLADRANLYFKVGNFVNISFDSEEKLLIQKIADVETFDDALRVAEELYLYCKKEKEEKVDDMPMPPNEMGGESEQPANESVQEQQESAGEGASDFMTHEEMLEEAQRRESAPATLNDEPEVQTADALESNLQDLVDTDSRENVYVEIPKVDLKYIIAKNDDIHKDIDAWFNHQKNNCSLGIFESADEEFVKFKRNAQKEVNYLVKEFECRKAADSYARATTARTGVLDTSKLHTYKYNEDLFKKVSVIPDGKNHGLIFVLDWSGSMSRVMLDTIKQLYNLIWFCKKVSIPFEVYAFTNEWKKPEMNYETGELVKPADWTSSYVKKENLLAVHEQFSMMNLLTSKTNGKQLEHQLINIWRIAKSFSNFYGSPYSVPTRLGLSGTPLNEAFVCLHQILPQFQKQNKLQKVQCIALTDGEANHLTRHVEVKRHWENEPYMGTRQLSGGVTFLRDRKTGNTYQVPYGYHGFSDLMLQNLRDNFPTVNFVGIRVLEGRDANHFMRLYYDQNSNEFRKIQSEWKKQRSCIIKTSGYHAYFAMSAASLSQDADFEVDDGATKAKIKSAFIKSLKTKKLNKKVLGEFISLVA
jgi:hypothetical protein